VTAAPLRVGVVGTGAIGSVLLEALRTGGVPNATLAGVVEGRSDGRAALDSFLAACDVVVEAASQAAVAEYGPVVKAAGVDLVVRSVGAFADDELLRALGAPSGGRLRLSTGACGGIDLLRAAHRLRPLDEVGLRTTKASSALVRDWMDDDLRRRLTEGDEELTVFRGSARDAVRRFPETANISALLGLATVGLDATAVEVRAAPGASSAMHEISARGAAGTYRFTIENAVAPENRRTSAVTAYAVLRELADLTSPFVPGW
jgi:aspartate dehydrogenase